MQQKKSFSLLLVIICHFYIVIGQCYSADAKDDHVLVVVESSVRLAAGDWMIWDPDVALFSTRFRIISDGELKGMEFTLRYQELPKIGKFESGMRFQVRQIECIEFVRRGTMNISDWGTAGGAFRKIELEGPE